MTPGERWYQRLLRLYPREFRDEFSGPMAQLYRDRGRDESMWSLWRGVIVDLVRTAPSEHLSILGQDLRHAWRGLRRTPVITATAVLTLALGVGASTAIFSVVHATLLRPLPYPDADRLVEIFEENLTRGLPRFRASALNYLSWTARARGLEAIGAFGSDTLTLTDEGDPELLNGLVTSSSFFRVLGLAPIVGRTLQPEDEQTGSPRVVVLGEVLWRSRFGADPRIVGRSLTLGGQRHQIVGVMPRAFRGVGRTQAAGTADAQIFTPLSIDPTTEHRGNHTLRAVGRLRRGVALDQAREEMRSVAAALQQEFPATNTNWSVRIEPLSETTIDPAVRRSLLLVFGAVAMVFLIACANVANLLLARATRRQTELAVRTALGAGRSRLVRQLITESAVLAAISGVAGITVAIVAHPVVRALLPPTMPRLDDIHLDIIVLAFGLLVSTMSGIVLGVVPAVRASRLDLSRSLTGVGRQTMDVSRVRVRQLLIVGQMALATLLLVNAALLLQGFSRLQHVRLGFDPTRVWTTRVALPRTGYPDAARAGGFYDRLLTTLVGTTAWQGVAVATSAPFGPGVRAGFQPRDRARLSTGDTSEGAAEHIVSADYFRVLGVPLLAGRSFNGRDDEGTAPVAVVSQRFARSWWADRSPLGQTIERSGRTYEVVGVVGDVRGSDTQGAFGGGADRDPRAAVYFASAQLPQRTMTLLVRANADPTSILGRVREVVRELDPTLAIQPVRPMGDWFEDSVAPTRLTTTLAIAFAVSALLLAAVGIYGVLAFTVASRTNEIGVRMAIGATRGRVIALVLRDGMTWAASGIVLGLIGALATASLIATLLFEVPARDPITFTTVGVAMALVAMAACAIPAARAVRIDPTIAMRAE
jgi:putative ABC transport system permease protein